MSKKYMSREYPLVSVIIPTYNRKLIAEAAIKSVVMQDYNNIEIIVVDDGSTDGTFEYLTRCFPNITILTQNNKGVSSARNLGIKNASGEWIALLDSDDIWLPQKLSIQMSYIEEKKHYSICHTSEIWFRNGVRVNPMQKHVDSSEDLFRTSLKLCVISSSSVIIHKEVFNKIGLYDESLEVCEDYDLWLRITSQYKVLFLDRNLVKKYGGNKDQLSKKHWGMDRFRIKSMEKLLLSNVLNQLQKNDLQDSLQEKLKIFILGAVKRGNIDGVREYKKIYSRHIGQDSFYNGIRM